MIVERYINMIIPFDKEDVAVRNYLEHINFSDNRP